MSLRILFVAPYVPSIVRIRPFAFIRELARLGHKITLICLVQPSWEENYLQELIPFCEEVHPVYLPRYSPYFQAAISIFTRYPLSVAFCQSVEFNQLIHKT